MPIDGYRITSELKFEPVPLGEIAGGVANGQSHWVNVRESDPEVRDRLLESLDISPFVRKLCQDAAERPGIYPLRSEIFLTFPAIPEDGDRSKMDQVVVLISQDLVIVVHDHVILTESQIAEVHQSEQWLTEPTAAGFVCCMFRLFSMSLARKANSLRSAVRAAEEQLDRDPDSLHADFIIDLRAELSRLEWIAGELLPTVEGLRASDTPFFQPGASGANLQAAAYNLRATDRLLLMLDNRIASLRSGFQMHAQDKTNSRLGMLTILSAIFMPITLLAGIWGMNFQAMPELSWPWAYPTALGLMVCVGAGMYLYFKRAGWFN